MNLNDYLNYPAVLHFNKDDGSYTVFIRGIDGCISEGKSYDDALKMAKAAVIDWALCLGKAEQMPVAHKAEKGDILISIGYELALKIMLRNLMIAENWRIIDIANKLSYSRQRIKQTLLLNKGSKIGTLAKIFDAIGHPLQISC